MPRAMPALAIAIKTALKGAEGCTLSRRQLKEELEPELTSQCGDDKTSKKAAFTDALEALMTKGKVTIDGTMIAISGRGKKRAPEESATPADEQGCEDAEMTSAKRAKTEVVGTSGTVSEAAEAFRKTHQISVVGDSPEPLPEPFLSFDACESLFGSKIVSQLKSGFKEPSPIQAQSWPVALGGKDMVAVAKTGSGKTLAFLLPALQAVLQHGKAAGPRVLVLAPTRELATQIEEVAQVYSGLVDVGCACVYGGVPKEPQAKALKKKPGLVIATPGRMVDMLRDKATDLASVKVAVLDEADRMLDMGFQPQISELFQLLPAVGERQVLFFTATWPKAVKKMAASYLTQEFVHLNIGSFDQKGPTANTAVTQEFHQLDDTEKDNIFMRELFKMTDDAKVVVFTNTKRRADNLAKTLWGNGYGCAAIHGDKTQVDREKALAAFRSGEWPVLVATDVAARGLDIDSVTHVVNFDMPRDVEGYVHRIGRTGRAGKSGVSITFWNPDYDKECAPALAKIARDAGQPVPVWLDAEAKKQGAGKKNWACAKIADAMATSA